MRAVGLCSRLEIAHVMADQQQVCASLDSRHVDCLELDGAFTALAQHLETGAELATGGRYRRDRGGAEAEQMVDATRRFSDSKWQHTLSVAIDAPLHASASMAKSAATSSGCTRPGREDGGSTSNSIKKEPAEGMEEVAQRKAAHKREL